MKLLHMFGHHVISAGDGLTAIQNARIERPDVVLMDIGLPGMDGYQVAEQLRKENGCEGALLVAISGYGQAATGGGRARQASTIISSSRSTSKSCSSSSPAGAVRRLSRRGEGLASLGTLNPVRRGQSVMATPSESDRSGGEFGRAVPRRTLLNIMAGRTRAPASMPHDHQKTNDWVRKRPVAATL